MDVKNINEYDWIIIGSGFGGSVSALRLAEKGYKVLVIEKGKRFTPKDFPKSNWQLRRWLWAPLLGCRGLFKMTFFRHLTVFSGVGVGGGSLVYACTLPTPTDAFFQSSSWAHLADWKTELTPHYQTARQMLGSQTVPYSSPVDKALEAVANDMGTPENFGPTDVSIYFGEPAKTVSDPYFEGKGPARTGCRFCGGCMLGCRHGSKNSLDQNYLYLAETLGVEILSDTEVTAVQPQTDGSYHVIANTYRSRLLPHKKQIFSAPKVVFAGGVLGTVDLLLKLKSQANALPKLSPLLGQSVRTNSESLTGIVSLDKDVDHSQGVAIGSILHTDAHSHLEPVRYPAGSGFFRLLVTPLTSGATVWMRLVNIASFVLKHPWRWWRAMTVPDFAKVSAIMLYMRTLEGVIGLKRNFGLWGRFGPSLRTQIPKDQPIPTAHMPEATALNAKMAEKLNGVGVSLLTETVLNAPSTAHILGGCCMGQNAEEGVIDPNHRIFGYDGLYVIDGSAVSANPGVNPSLTITALAERAMQLIPVKEKQ